MLAEIGEGKGLVLLGIVVDVFEFEGRLELVFEGLAVLVELCVEDELELGLGHFLHFYLAENLNYRF